MSGSVIELKRELQEINSDKQQLLKTARRLSTIDRVRLSADDVRTLGIEGEVKSVRRESEFRDVWEDIVDVMGVVAPTETAEETTADGDVYFCAVAPGSSRELQVEYHSDGSLTVKALWAASASVSRAMVVVGERYEL